MNTSDKSPAPGNASRRGLDVLVVGLGPAGASAAAEAAKRGARVLGIDRKANAGQPVQCAEFVPHLIGMEIDALATARRQDIAAMATYIERQSAHIEPQFPGVMIDRARFDAALAGKAAAAGAECRFAASLRTLGDDGSALLSDGSLVSPRVIVGADGPRSRVGRAIGAANTDIAETRQITVPLLRPFEATDIFLSADIPGGYAWLFPKGEVANLGLGVAPQWRHLLKPELERLHAGLVEDGRVGAQILARTGGAIPVGGLRTLSAPLGDATVLLAGDAAGLANPVTGAGIASAVISGRLAGEAAARIAIENEGCAAEDYAEEIADLFETSLARALARRQALMNVYAQGGRPEPAELRRGWIAFPEYWAA